MAHLPEALHYRPDLDGMRELVVQYAQKSRECVIRVVCRVPRDSKRVFGDAPPMQGIASALILPTERSLSVRDVKRALLTYDSVHVLAAEDRELIAPVAFMSVTTGMPYGVSGRSVLPLGKVADHDKTYERVIEELQPAVAEERVRIRSAPAFAEGSVIGSIPVPEGWPAPAPVFHIFRQMAAQPRFLSATRAGVTWIDGMPLDELNAVALGGDGLMTANTLPALAGAETFGEGETSRATQIVCAARLGAFVKALAICHVSNLHPFTSDAGHLATLELLELNASDAAAVCDNEGDDYALGQLRRLDSVIFREHLDPHVLDAMSVADVLKLRTRSWGVAAEGRRKTLAAIRALARECPSAPEFERRVKQEIDAYMKIRANLDLDWSNLRLSLMCDVVIGAFAATSGLVEKMLGLSTLEALLLLGPVIAAQARSSVPQIRKLLHAQAELDSDLGYGLFGPHRFLANPSSRQ